MQNHAKTTQTTQNQELREIETMRNHAQPCETLWNHMKPQKTMWNLEEFILICFTGRKQDIKSLPKLKATKF